MTASPFYVSTPVVSIPQPLSVSIQTQNPSQLQNQNTSIGKVMFSDSTDKDAFYRLRTSQPYTLFEANTIYNNNSLLFDYETTPNCSVSSTPSGACMTHTVSSSALINQFSAQQTHYYAHYQPGKSYLAMFSFLLGTATQGITKRVGFYDVDNNNFSNPQNGIFLEQTSNGLYWCLYQGSPGNSIERIVQSDWNVDTFDGNGPSGITLDATKNMLGWVDLEWLGVGRLRCGFFVNGVPLIAHVVNNTDKTLPYINNPYLPIRFEIRKTESVSTSDSLKVYCCTIISEGGYNPIGIVTTFQGAKITGLTSRTTVAIRLKSSYPRAMIIPLSVEIISNLSGSSSVAIVTVYLWRVGNYTVTKSFTSYEPYSIVEYTEEDLGTDLNNGTLLTVFKSSVSSTTKVSFTDIPESLLIAQSEINRNFRDIIVVKITEGGSKDFTTLLSWKEIF